MTALLTECCIGTRKNFHRMHTTSIIASHQCSSIGCTADAPVRVVGWSYTTSSAVCTPTFPAARPFQLDPCIGIRLTCRLVTVDVLLNGPIVDFGRVFGAHCQNHDGYHNCGNDYHGRHGADDASNHVWGHSRHRNGGFLVWEKRICFYTFMEI